MTISNEGPSYPNFVPLRRTVSPEQRFNNFHSDRVAGTGQAPFEDRRTSGPVAAETDEEHSLKVARAQAVEFVVKAFAAVDRNLALADKARLQQEKCQAEAQQLRARAEEELAAASRLREDAEREMTSARSLAEEALTQARAESARIVDAAHERARAETESARSKLTDSLATIRDLMGQATGTIDAFVNKPAIWATAEQILDLQTVDVRESETPGRERESEGVVVALPFSSSSGSGRNV